MQYLSENTIYSLPLTIPVSLRAIALLSKVCKLTKDRCEYC